METMMIPAATTQNIMMTAAMPQNFAHTSPAFDFGRSQRSKVLESQAPDNPGPGNYKVEHDYPDYRGVYKNIGKLGKKKKRSGSDEGDLEEVEEVAAAPVHEDSDGSENEHEEKKAEVVEDRTPEASQIVDEGPVKSKIPG
jgi:hypothetical protein